ncbi:MAG: PsbP-related protein [Chloroflexota bacterium]
MSSRVKKLLVISALVVVILIPLVFIIRGQAAKKASEPAPSSTPVRLSYTSAKHNFALKFPQYWLDEEFEDPIVNLTSPRPPDDKEYSGATISVKVFKKLSEEDRDVTLDDFVVKSEDNLRQYAQNYTRISLEETKISNLPARILTWNMSAEKTMITRQAILFKDDSIYVITYSSLAEYDDLYASAFDLVTSTFRFY